MKKLKKLFNFSSHHYMWAAFVFLTVLCFWMGYSLCSIDNGANIIPISTKVTEREISVEVDQNHFRYDKVEGVLKSDCSFVLEEKNESDSTSSRNVVKELVYSKSSNQFIERTTVVEKDFNKEKERNRKMWKSVWGKVAGIVLYIIGSILFAFFLLTVVIWCNELSYYRKK